MTVTRDVNAAPRQRVWEVLADGWPAVLSDETVVQSSEVGRELVLLAKVRPAAKARITMRLSDLPDGGCRVEMTEVAVSRPLRWLPDSLQVLGVAPSSRECTWRLATIAQKRDPDAIE